MQSASFTIAFTLAAAPAFAASCTEPPFSDPKSVMSAMIQCFPAPAKPMVETFTSPKAMRYLLEDLI